MLMISSATSSLSPGAGISKDVAVWTACSSSGQVFRHLPAGWHHETESLSVFEAACGPLIATA
jgi:hypothetical protein